MFDELHHADWSVDSRKRWVTSAYLREERWCVCTPKLVGDPTQFLDTLISHAKRKHILAGFDFPIGLPSAYGGLTCFKDFKEALSELGIKSGWENFYDVAETEEEICIQRPFYPRRPIKGVTRNSLVSKLGVSNFDKLYRECERAGSGLRGACCLFWTLGGNQVGKGAITGWQEIVGPATQQGAHLWPFDGNLQKLASMPGLVIAETYPADAYRLVGAEFSQNESKRRQEDRAAKAQSIIKWSQDECVSLSRDVHDCLVDGFGSNRAGEDAFDSLLGLLKMIRVVNGSIREASRNLQIHEFIWEGWILGR